MLFTDDRQRNAAITNPKNKQRKTCWVQVEHIAQPEQIEQLRQGVMLKDGMTHPAKVRAIEAPTLRLVRVSIGDYELGDLGVGTYVAL